MSKFGHGVRLMQPSCVKGHAKRGSEAEQEMIRGIISPPNDQADAEAIREAVSRPSMRFVELCLILGDAA